MEKITLTKKINYYKKNDFLYSCELYKKKYDILDDALRELQKITLKYVENKKDISAYEEAYILYKNNDNHFIKYNKTIDIITKETTDNIPNGSDSSAI